MYWPLVFGAFQSKKQRSCAGVLLFILTKWWVFSGWWWKTKWHVSFTISDIYPKAPCREYLPTFEIYIYTCIFLMCLFFAVGFFDYPSCRQETSNRESNRQFQKQPLGIVMNLVYWLYWYYLKYTWGILEQLARTMIFFLPKAAQSSLATFLKFINHKLGFHLPSKQDSSF